MSTNSLQEQLEFALDAAWDAGRVTLRYFQTDVAVERKDDESPVTIADREAEQVLRARIERRWPEAGIVGEEFENKESRSGLTWIVDPIDGTKSFIHGVPLYGILIALVDDGGPLVGVTHFPALNETIYAANGQGCYWNGRRAHVSEVDSLSDATIVTSALKHFAPQGKSAAWQRLVDATSVQRTWGDAYGYALVATGRADIMVDPIMAVWDAGPLQVIIQEAGGHFTDWQGAPTIHGGEGIATNAALFEQVMALI